MNQDKVKEILLELDSSVEDFSVVFTGKESTKVDGLYNRETCEILIHNRNFKDDNALIYTAIHEFAHHIQFTKIDPDRSSRAHTVSFWNTFHSLLDVAEEKKYYINIFNSDDKFLNLTKEIKENYLTQNGQLMKDFGKLLVEAYDLCQRNHAEFEDYVDRALCMNRSAAKNIMKVYAMDVEPSLGFDNMKIVAGVKDNNQRKKAEESFKQGLSPNEVRAEINESKPEPKITIKKLESEKVRLEKSIHALQVKLADLEMKIDEYEG
ncbi:hypothetical protein EW093_14245 [Thiospirochaeta perfilievii]|uniref:SprT-like domain-containing protein n=1 Tax=Thiospirochaeta perfilievii TaxID=252967 RepID=A0A5C1QCI7_9SPIO|nr:hypothetical protein [Thiospirochaeta perfilievii]QEN05813.1 hypothetical protein EW093_14245 [Thiospirochaeta perfilievii]